MSGSMSSRSTKRLIRADPSKLSSAHVYLRQTDSQPHGEWDKLPAALLMDAAQLVKANSIEGAPDSSRRQQLTARKQEGQCDGSCTAVCRDVCSS